MNPDVLIVGGRPAGASLAARLGRRGAKVIVLDRATFPSLPAVPSSPVLYSAGMHLLSEIGVEESGYFDPSAQMRALRFEVEGHFSTTMRVPRLADGRDYVLGLDRSTFDDLLWRNLDRFPSVTRRDGFAVTDLLRDGDRVIGVVGTDRSGAREEIQARAVVGADGRFSVVARRAGAEIVEEEAEKLSTVYYADWEGVAPFDPGGPAAAIFTAARGLNLMCFAMPKGRISVNTHARADRVHVDGDAERYYRETLRSLPSAQPFLEGAKQVSPISGIKRIGNGYRRTAGLGWVLVGDALHYKDPVDGQGIYDALIEAKLLDVSLSLWLEGKRSWDEATSAYAEAMRAATHPMFLATVGRLKRELYEEPPPAVIRTVMRWTMSDPTFQETFIRFLARELPENSMSSKALLAGAMLRGVARDAAGLFHRN